MQITANRRTWYYGFTPDTEIRPAGTGRILRFASRAERDEWCGQWLGYRRPLKPSDPLMRWLRLEMQAEHIEWPDSNRLDVIVRSWSPTPEEIESFRSCR